MKPNRHEHAAARAQHVEQLAPDIYLRQRAALVSGDAAAIRDLSNGLLE